MLCMSYVLFVTTKYFTDSLDSPQIMCSHISLVCMELLSSRFDLNTRLSVGFETPDPAPATPHHGINPYSRPMSTVLYIEVIISNLILIL